MENKNLPNNAKKQCRQPQQQCRSQHRPQQQCRSQHRPQVVNISVNIGTIIMPVTVNVNKGGKREGEQQPSQFDQLVKEVLAAVSKKLQQ